jgi:hypothetical protein
MWGINVFLAPVVSLTVAKFYEFIVKYLLNFDALFIRLLNEKENRGQRSPYMAPSRNFEHADE